MSKPAPIVYPHNWAGIKIEISYIADWLDMGITSHIEVRADEPLPFTETGYRSIFLNPETVQNAGGAVAYVEGFLDEAAERPVWQKYHQERQQFALF